MMGDAPADLDEALRRLRTHDASRERADLVLQRCHAALAARPSEQRGRGAGLMPIGALAVCSVYLAAVVQVAVAFLRAVG